MSGNKCAYNNCGLSTRNDHSLRFFHFPVKDPTRCKQWIIHSGNITLPGLSPKSPSKKFLCSRHFNPLFLQHKRLPLDAVPDKYESQDESEDDVEKENLIFEQSMVRKTYGAHRGSYQQQDQPSTSKLVFEETLSSESTDEWLTEIQNFPVTSYRKRRLPSAQEQIASMKEQLKDSRKQINNLRTQLSDAKKNIEGSTLSHNICEK